MFNSDENHQWSHFMMEQKGENLYNCGCDALYFIFQDCDMILKSIM